MQGLNPADVSYWAQLLAIAIARQIGSAKTRAGDLWYNHNQKGSDMAGKKKDPSASAAACAQKALKISAKARYALRALIDVASHAESDSPRTGAAIAKEQHLSEKFLSRIVIPLRRNGLLRSVRGNIGGFRLAKSPDNITLLEIIETMQGPLAILDCLQPRHDCPKRKNCLARRVWADVNSAFANTLESVTLAHILARDPKAAQALDYCI